MESLLLLHIVSTWFMAGVIWTVQVVHYPLFCYTDGEWFRPFMADHARRITRIVGPARLIELVTGLGLAFYPHSHMSAPEGWLGLGLIALIWTSTILLQMPQHRILALGYHPATHRRLVVGNWIRTCLWTVRAILVCTWLA